MKLASVEFECSYCGFYWRDEIPFASEQELTEEVWKFCPKCGKHLRIKKLEVQEALIYRYGE